MIMQVTNPKEFTNLKLRLRQCLDSTYSTFAFSHFTFPSFFFFIFFSPCMRFSFRGQCHCSCTVHGTHNHFIQKKNIKNGSHGNIYTFKNYFTTIFLVFSKISCIQTDPKYKKSYTIPNNYLQQNLLLLAQLPPCWTLIHNKLLQRLWISYQRSKLQGAQISFFLGTHKFNKCKLHFSLSAIFELILIVFSIDIA